MEKIFFINFVYGFVFWRYLYEDGNEGFGGGQPFLETETFLESYLPLIKAMAEKKERRPNAS